MGYRVAKSPDYKTPLQLTVKVFYFLLLCVLFTHNDKRLGYYVFIFKIYGNLLFFNFYTKTKLKTGVSGVKVQRVDGSWCKLFNNNLMHLRYTLTGLERGYPVKILSKQLEKKFKFYYSKISCFPQYPKNYKNISLLNTSNEILNPYFVTGFTDAEGSFSVTIYPDSKMKSGVRVNARFKIGLNERDLYLLVQIKKFFGEIGSLIPDKSAKAWTYTVSSKKDLLNVIIPHFKNYPLITQKLADFNLFIQIVELLEKGAHLNNDFLQQIVNLRASLNKGSSDFIKLHFPQIEPVTREIIKTTAIPDPFWISGFVSGEGNFDAGIRRATTIRKERVYLRFRITQHNRDINLMNLIIKYFGLGRLELDNRKNESTVTIVVGKFLDITNEIIPFFDKHPIIGVKYLDYLDWVKIANLMLLGKNKTAEGMEEIKLIESSMNKNRK